MNAGKRDNLVDAIGYIGLIERINEFGGIKWRWNKSGMN
jgi:hypothetical protein